MMRTFARLAWVFFNFLFAAAGGAILAFGPLDGDQLFIISMALIAGLVGGGLWARQQAAAARGEEKIARSWKKRLSASMLAIILFVSITSFVQLYQNGQLPPFSKDRVANFDRLWRSMNTQYPYFELKGIDWQAFYSHYRPLVEAAQSDQEFFSVLSDMLAELNDDHTGLVSSPLSPLCRFVIIQEIDSQAVVTTAGETALAAGLFEGSVITAVDGQPVSSALDLVSPQLTAGSTPWRQRSNSFLYLLASPPGGTRRVSFDTSSGLSQHASLECKLRPGPGTSMDETISWEWLPSGYGYIRIPTFGKNLINEFDAAIEELMDAPGLVLDIRGNGGGNSMYADAIAGRLIANSFPYGRDNFRSRIVLHGWRSHFEYRVTPRSEVYGGPVILIVDSFVMSSAEQFTVSLVDSGRVTTIGRQTGGASGNPITFNLPGGKVRFSTGDFRRMDGTRLEGLGIMPDFEVLWSLGDLRDGLDPDLKKAIEILDERID
jgi:carboxyl-terminal processing protease